MGCQGGSCDRKRSRSNSGSCDRKQSHISVKVTAKDTDAAYAVSTPREKFLSKCCKKYKHPKVRSLFDYNEEVKTTYVPKQYYINTGHMRQRLSMKFPCGGNMPNIHGIVQCQPERQPLSTCDPPVEICVPSMHTVISKTQAPCVLDLCSLKHLEAPCCVQECDADMDELAYCCDDPDPCCDPCGDNPCCCNPCSPCCPKTPCTPSHCNAGCCQPLCCPPTCFSKNNSKSPSVCSVPRAKTPPRPRSLTPPPRQRTKPRPAPRSPSIHTRKSSVYSNKSQSACQSYSDECLSVDIVNETPECKAICKLRLASLAVLYLVTFIGLLIIMCLNCFGSVFVICGNVLLLYLIAYDFFTSRDPVHQLEDHDADAILRLRSGNTALLSNLKEIGLSKCSICPCREAEETVNHVLNECRLYAACRNCTWPCGGDVYSKLYGKAEQLEKTVRFFGHIGLRIRLDDRTLEECCM